MFRRKPSATSQAKSQTSSSGLSAGLEGTTTLIANNTRIAGDVFFEEQLYVNGVIEGDVTAVGAKPAEGPLAKDAHAGPDLGGPALGGDDLGSGIDAPENGGDTLVVCEGGRVIGEIRAPNVVIDGTVEGDVYATAKLELAAKARVLGNVHYNLVEMHLGSVVNGQMLSLTKAANDAKSEREAQEKAKQKMREAAGDVVTGIR